MSDNPPSPLWLNAARLPALTAHERDWLCNEDSLTRRLTALSDDDFSVMPLYEGWQALRGDECAALDVAQGSQGWIREVYLRGRAQPWVFARSVAARSALENAAMNLQQLGSRSLGELLFSDQAFERGALDICRYPTAWLPAERRDEALWARRSCFRRGALGVLVAEVFLPDFWRAAAAHAGKP
ncbi:chorismate lyase [Pseudomonas flavescens]|uniref:Probable chorismate pyruvate-lyase n=1 Tax=Phytopseudomonas flavescens TaxID=29435 RepID=A0A1G8A4R5_9GAMM|nr:chorismate lyase [Pseudomonas flavescens]SDH15863.1 chorismate lyase [Pseudomonas flavescens]